ncbi:hypothetical protein AAC387_Pa06g0901 [Persea americana]
MRLVGPSMVWLELQSEAVVTWILHLAAVAQKSPFQVLQRWMEVLGSPPCEVWIRLKGVPLHVWRAETFSLLGEYLGSMLEVDPATSRMENLLFERVKSR